MPTAADTVRTLVEFDLDDQGLRFSDDLFLRQLSRAQQWIVLRYSLLRTTVPVTLIPGAPFYAVPTVAPRLVAVTRAQLSDGTVLWPVAFAHLRSRDPQWIVTPGTPRHIYRVGWRYIGVYPVPTVADVLQVTGVVVPERLSALTDLLDAPDAYVPQVVELTAGLLVLTQERRYSEGLERIRVALGLPAPKAQPISVVPTTPEEVR